MGELADKVSKAEAASWVLAFLIACDRGLDPQAASRLQALEGFGRLGVSARELDARCRACAQEFGNSRERSWIPAHEEARLNGMLDAIDDPALRMLVCELAHAVNFPERREGPSEHLLFDHVLAHWHIDRRSIET